MRQNGIRMQERVIHISNQYVNERKHRQIATRSRIQRTSWPKWTFFKSHILHAYSGALCCHNHTVSQNRILRQIEQFSQNVLRYLNDHRVCFHPDMLHSTIQLVNSWSRDGNHEFKTCEWNAVFNDEVENSSCTNPTRVHRSSSRVHEFTRSMERYFTARHHVSTSSPGQWNAISLLVNSLINGTQQ